MCLELNLEASQDPNLKVKLRSSSDRFFGEHPGEQTEFLSNLHDNTDRVLSLEIFTKIKTKMKSLVRTKFHLVFKSPIPNTYIYLIRLISNKSCRLRNSAQQHFDFVNVYYTSNS